MSFTVSYPIQNPKVSARTGALLHLALFTASAAFMPASLRAQSSCSNLAGVWAVEERATLACSVTVAGQTDRYSDPLSASRNVTISQGTGSCSFSYDPGTIGAGRVVQYERAVVTGQISGNSVTTSGGQLLTAAGAQLTESSYRASGEASGSGMTLAGSGTIRGTQVVEGGLTANINCSLTGTAAFTRIVQPTLPSITELNTVPSPPVAGQQFGINITGTDFNPANVQILFIGSGCNPCTVTNAVLATRTSTLIAGLVTLNTAGTFAVSVRNGAGGASNSLAIAVQSPPQPANFQWTRQFGTPGQDGASGVALDSTGIYFAGSVNGLLPGQTAAGGFDAYVRKYDGNGNELWTRQFGSSAFDSAYGAAGDPTGLYVVGSTSGSLPGQTSLGTGDAFVRKYDTSGNEVWTRQFGSSDGDAASGVAADATSVYVAGYTTGTLRGQTRFGATDAFVQKYDANGNEQWTRQFGTAGADLADNVTVDATGVYVVGVTGGALPGQTAAGSGDAFVRKYDFNGNVLWTRQFGTAGGDRAFEAAVSAAGLYVVGHVNGTSPTSFEGANAFVRKYDPNGALIWNREFGSPVSGNTARAVAADATGIYVAGHVRGALPGLLALGSADAFVRKYDAAGNDVWTRQFGSNSIDFVDGIAVDATGVYLAGQTFGALPEQTTLGNYDSLAVKLSDGSTPLPRPEVNDGGVVNNASFVSGAMMVAPGSIAAVFGKNMNSGAAVPSSSFGADGKLVTSLGGGTVTINNIPAPLLYSTPGQLGIQIPFELAGQTSATIQIVVGGQSSPPRTIFLAPFAPGLFTLSQDGKGSVAALHQDGVTPITPEKPAKPGEVISLYGTGLGTLTPAVATGARSPANRTAAEATLTLDGVLAEVLFAGAAPGFVGLNQVNIRIPANVRLSPNVPLVLTIGGKQSNVVTVPVSP